ncbi:hypothetical protein B0T11DRAFT_83185 [Plectosphaerella cucumerina]|uniref:Uncharacterized protein n=1 Tax=Plectosphaerella cucumerina TaxID=40658 RepID=A0A8K0TGK3_9PEZI|nr:hypothetical protein B0T11DRAFT_83185 [Plectosphaerella cucumerina]
MLTISTSPSWPLCRHELKSQKTQHVPHDKCRVASQTKALFAVGSIRRAAPAVARMLGPSFSYLSENSPPEKGAAKILPCRSLQTHPPASTFMIRVHPAKTISKPQARNSLTTHRYAGSLRTFFFALLLGALPPDIARNECLAAAVANFEPRPSKRSRTLAPCRGHSVRPPSSFPPIPVTLRFPVHRRPWKRLLFDPTGL